jgi:transcriptional regulator with XRE-family HTH domain
MADGAKAEKWGHRLTQLVGRNVEARRQQLGLTSIELAARCKALGHPLHRVVISNLENGYREGVSLADLLTLARALDMPPALLAFPLGSVAEVEALPGQSVETWPAYSWFVGETSFPGADDATDWASNDGRVGAYRRHAELLMTWTNNARALAANERDNALEQETRDALARRSRHMLELAEGELRELRRHLRTLGLLPPPLPPVLAHLDEVTPTTAGQP